jgi:hypothetical protein
LFRKPGHETLESCLELRQVELTEQPAKRIMAGHNVLEFEEAAQIRLLRLPEQRHINRTLAAAENRA